MDEGIQTVFEKYMLSAKVETMILKKRSFNNERPGEKIVSSLSFEVITQSPDLMKHFVGLTYPQLKVLYNFLNDVCPLKWKMT